MLKVRSLTKKNNGSIILDNLSFNINDGDIIAIVSEKMDEAKELLKCIIDDDNYDSGSIELFFGNCKNKIEMVKKIFFIPENIDEKISLKPLELITYFAALKNDNLNIVVDNFNYYINLFYIKSETINTCVSDLDTFNQKLIYLIMALSLNVKLLVIDQLFKNLGVIKIKKIIDILKMLKTNKVSTILSISNDNAKYIQKTINKAMLIKSGKIIRFIDVNGK